MIAISEEKIEYSNIEYKTIMEEVDNEPIDRLDYLQKELEENISEYRYWQWKVKNTVNKIVELSGKLK